MKSNNQIFRVTKAIGIMGLVGHFIFGTTYVIAAENSVPKSFALVKVGDTQEQVLKTLGKYRDTALYTARNELDWNYVTCNNGRSEVHSIQFDTRTGRVVGSVTTPDTMNNSDAFPACPI